MKVTDEAVIKTQKKSLSELEGKESGLATIEFILQAASACLDKLVSYCLVFILNDDQYLFSKFQISNHDEMNLNLHSKAMNGNNKQTVLSKLAKNLLLSILWGYMFVNLA